MTRHRAPSKKSKYYLPKESFLTAVHYCKQYPLWVAEIETIAGTVKGISYDKPRVQASSDYDPTEEAAIRLSDVSKKKDLLDKIAVEIGGNLAEWIVYGVCYDMPYYKLQMKGIPCGKDLYYLLRRRFYYEVSKRI
ncbi:MAG: hypothetical protein IKG71_03395 [Firmicutes bacterium]|nr:hypothetical protein [Bacillota bacterium]